MTQEIEIKVGQVWRRKKGGKLIRIARQLRTYNGSLLDDWVWESVEGRRGGNSCSGWHLRSHYILTPEAAPETDPRVLSERLRKRSVAEGETLGNSLYRDAANALDKLVGPVPEPERTYQELMEASPLRYIAARDSEGSIRLSGGQGLRIADADDTRFDVQGWFDYAGGPKWAAQYRAALNLFDQENSTKETE